MLSVKTPLHDRVFVRIAPEGTEEEVTESGLVIPKSNSPQEAGMTSVIEGEIVSVGQGEILYDGQVRPLHVKPGQKVLFDIRSLHITKEAQTPLDYAEGLVSEREILAISG